MPSNRGGLSRYGGVALLLWGEMAPSQYDLTPVSSSKVEYEELEVCNSNSIRLPSEQREIY